MPELAVDPSGPETQLDTETPNRTGFMDLPRELRDKIYQYVLHTRRSPKLSRLRLHQIRTAYYPLTILLLNHQIKEEFIDIAAKYIGAFSLDVEEVAVPTQVGMSMKFCPDYYPFDTMKVHGSTTRSGMVEFDPLWFKYVSRLRISATIFRGAVNDKTRHLLKYDHLRVVKLLLDRHANGLLEHVKELEVEIVLNFVAEQEWLWKMVEPLKGLPMIKSICVRRHVPEAWWFKEESIAS
jgi:hypothetical protein